MTGKTSFIYPRLSFAYFLQFAIWGSWAMTLGGYAGKVLNLDMGLLYTAIPLAAVSALFVGPIVDRKYSAQKVLALLHFIGGLLLIACAFQKDFKTLFILMLAHGVCYMPTIPLLNSVVFRHIPDSNTAPRIFVLGTVGWIVANLIIDVACGGAATPYFFFIGGGASLLMGVYCMTLPATPPLARAEGSNEKPESFLAVFGLFKNIPFAIFTVCVLVASIPACGFYFPMLVTYLTERGYPSPVALTTLNQFSELFFMVALSLFATKYGLKKCLLIGMGAWIVRYLFFIQSAFVFALLGLLVHGLCYSFFYVAAYMYADKVAPPRLKASMQSLMAFLLLGVGQVFGSLLLSYQLSQFPAPVDAMPSVAVLQEAEKTLPAWNDPKMENSSWKYLNLSETANFLISGKTTEAAPHLGVLADKAVDSIITWTSINSMPEEGLTLGANVYSKGELKQIFDDFARFSAKGHSGDPVGEVALERADWLKAQSKVWEKILFLPMIMAILSFLIFMALGKDPVEITDKKAQA